MSKPFALPLNLQLFSEDSGAAETGVESASAAEVQTETPEVTESQTGVETQAAAEPEKQNNFEKAFAKRLAAEREKWQSETSEKYKDYDTLKDVADYFREVNEAPDMMTLKERIEMERLQQRAERENVPPEVLQRIDMLEAKAAKADEFEQQQAQERTMQEFENGLKEFVKDKQLGEKPVDHLELWKYMHENGIAKPEVAFKAMKADQLETKLQERETDVINRYIQSKSAPKVESGGVAGMQSWKPTGDIDAATARAAARIRAANNPT